MGLMQWIASLIQKPSHTHVPMVTQQETLDEDELLAQTKKVIEKARQELVRAEEFRRIRRRRENQ